ncbi:N-6 DNA methylase [Vreelandella aquamarina]|uniref:N-6 DNA methylase n=1 Tax=Vreelandella aquamarina TaxID=77097 RepID=UPI002B1CE007|nr:N-6 DNA methylase [Halomonas axialensis]
MPLDRLITHKKDIYKKTLFGLDQERDLVKITKAYMSIVGDGTGGIFSANSLDVRKDLQAFGRKELREKNFDIVLTNPPFGKDIKVVGDLVREYELADFYDKTGTTKSKRSAVRPSVLFIERCVRLLKPDSESIAGIVLPVGDLSNDEDRHIKEWIFENCFIEAVIQLPSETFQPYTGTQTCLIFLRNKAEGDQGDVFMAQVEKVGKNQRGKAIFKRDKHGTQILDSQGQNILDDDLPEVLEEYRRFKNGKSLNTKMCFSVRPNDVLKSLLPNYHNPKNQNKKINNRSISYKRLSSLCSEIYTPPRTRRVYVEEKYGIPFLSGTHITQYIPQKVKYISKTETKNLERYIVREGDIVLTRVGTMGIVKLIGEDLDGWAVSDNINIIRIEKSIVDPEYVYSVLISKFGQNTVQQVKKGSVQDYNTPKAIGNLEIPVLPEPQYSEIVNDVKKSEARRVDSVYEILKASDNLNSYLS